LYIRNYKPSEMKKALYTAVFLGLAVFASAQANRSTQNTGSKAETPTLQRSDAASERVNDDGTAIQVITPAGAIKSDERQQQSTSENPAPEPKAAPAPKQVKPANPAHMGKQEPATQPKQ
jgi:hypothetical protein